MKRWTLMVCCGLLLARAHGRKERALEADPVGTIQRSDRDLFVGDPATRVACKADADRPTGALCHPGKDVCFSSYPDPRKLEFTPVAARGSAPVSSPCPLVTVHFPFDSAELVPEAQEWLGYDARCLRSRRPGRVVIEAHADSRGAEEYNLELPRKRGGAVRELLRQRRVEATLEVVPRGETDPFRKGRNERDFAYNRRVELHAA